MTSAAGRGVRSLNGSHKPVDAGSTPAPATNLICLSCSVMSSRAVEPTERCGERHHALITVRQWDEIARRHAPGTSRGALADHDPASGYVLDLYRS